MTQVSTTRPAPQIDRLGLSHIAYGFMASKALFAALGIDLFTHLAAGSRTAEELSDATAVPRNRLETLLHALGGVGLVVADQGGYANAPVAQRHLVRGTPEDLGDYFRLQVAQQIYPALLHLDAGLAGTGGAFDGMVGLLADPAEARTFTAAQHAGSLGAARALAGRLALRGPCELLDVGGGSGAFSIALCEHDPDLRATVLDLPAVVAVARGYRERAGLTDRITLLAADAVRDRWPADQDVVLNVLSAQRAGRRRDRRRAREGPGLPAARRVPRRARLHAARRGSGPGPGGAVVPAVPRLPARRGVVLRRHAGAAAASARVRAGVDRGADPRDHEGGPESEGRPAMTALSQVGARRLGVGLTPLETRRDVVVHVATRAEQLGYDAFYLPEGWGYDASVLLTEIAVRTSRIRLGTGVINIWGRGPAGIAMLATTLDEVSGGRFVLGLGVGSPQLAEGLHDVSFDAPVDRLGTVVRQVRRLLDGGRLAPSAPRVHGPLRLATAPRPRLPIHLAALGPASVRLAGELADGWYPFLLPRSALKEGIRQLEVGSARARRGGTPEISPCIPVAVSPDPAAARAVASWWVVFYLTSMGPLYRRALRRSGFGAAVDDVVAVNPTRRTAEVPAVGPGVARRADGVG